MMPDVYIIRALMKFNEKDDSSASSFNLIFKTFYRSHLRKSQLLCKFENEDDKKRVFFFS